jgi:hypothetical protein
MEHEMIKLDGTLRVVKIQHSRNGPFAVGTLATDIGKFKVKDQVLDQFDEGSYQVSAWITQIFPGVYVSAAGASVTEIRANLHDLQVHDEQLGHPANDEAAAEPDPLDERPPVTVRPAPSNESTTVESLEDLAARLKSIGKKRSKAKPDDATTNEEAANAPSPAPATALQQDEVQTAARTVFSDDLWSLIQARQPVKLDTTVDRMLFRQQAALLNKQLGYRFNSADQIFYPVN